MKPNNRIRPAFRQLLHRPADSHKYTYGHVLVIGGSTNMAGAPVLSARAALRAGAGLVTLASTHEVIQKIGNTTPELMTHTLVAEPYEAIQGILRLVVNRKITVVVIGPGMDTLQSKLINAIFGACKLPLIFDGGALSVTAQNPGLLHGLHPRILTPHSGEFQRFFDIPIAAGGNALLSRAKEFVAGKPVTLVLKGNPTHVINDGEIYANTSGGPGLATAGSGDVLSGIIAAMIAQGVEPFAASAAAVYLHGRAGDIATKANTMPGVIASDIIEALPLAYKQLEPLVGQAGD